MKKTDAIIIMDGFGNRGSENGNAVIKAGTPYIKSLLEKYPNTLIDASGRAVGLPAGQMGNSEVGHLNLGAGRVVYQDITKIDKAIEDGDFFTNPVLLGAMQNAKNNGTALHLVGLTSDGGVHSSINHLYALLEMAKRETVGTVYVHCVTDGRDVPPDSAIKYVAMVEDKIKEIGSNAVVATVEGRYYYMDRDNRWERVKKGYDGVFAGVGNHFDSAVEGVKASYENKVYDEFIEPIVVGDYKGVTAGDSIIFYNFRSDRAREISRAAIYADFDGFEREGGYKPVYYVGMTQYDATFTGIHTAFEPRELKNTLGEFLANEGYTQARVAETEKYAHVTFFFNGGVEQPNKNERRVLVASPKVATYDLQPEMSAPEVTEKALEVVGDVDVLILNFANCDMVGHTGVFDAAVKAVTTVDNCLSKLIPAILATGGTALVTADHGNAEQMSFDDGSPCTAHTTNLVPFVVVGEKYVGASLREGGALCDVAPTLLDVMGVNKPAEMEGTTLIK
ncbi:MAG: 2,3-bisphosphoglycerate-independent phosphoglycerate mutase [Clostridia bacterium]|nr:2,3-bisphosphoglycerate-independent phosphoglycerate mutase [Clostridia bacterium]MBQ7224678.1 2,3-bisphosphoglycerate-independent phosphoglycerate mutase [Clostridia bacterium]